ncbi:MAG TPA: PilZ domain-containing protein [Terriglobales bacterium]|nr:PilZ domain-containing protein [Terriglobales bacterium]
MNPQRASQRRPLQCQVECESDHHTFVAEGIDVSEHGLAFSANDHVQEGDELTVYYHPLEDDPLMVVRVRVIHVSGDRVGTQFLARHMRADAAKGKPSSSR